MAHGNGNGNGWRGIVIATAMAASTGIGGWFGKTVWTTQSTHAERITRVETKVEGLHDTLQTIQRTVERMDRRLERAIH